MCQPQRTWLTVESVTARANGDRDEIFRIIDREVAPEILRSLVRRFEDEHFAQEILQEALLELDIAFDRLAVNSPIVIVLAHFADNLAVDKYRATRAQKRGRGWRRRRVHLQEIPSPEPSPIGQSELEQFVIGLIDELPPELRLVMQLRFIEGCSTEEIAHHTGASQRTIQRRLKKAAAHLRKNRDIKWISGLLP